MIEKIIEFSGKNRFLILTLTALLAAGGWVAFRATPIDAIPDLSDIQVIVKSDQEPSIGYVVKDVLEAREEGRTLVEESPVQGSKSNGIVERAAQSLEGHMRAVLLGFEERVGVKLDPR